jgi:hypothetical protein
MVMTQNNHNTKWNSVTIKPTSIIRLANLLYRLSNTKEKTI